MAAKTAKNAPGPKIPRQKNPHPQKPGKQPLHPEIHTQQLNPISSRYGQPQYKDPKPSRSQKNLITRIKPF